MTVGLGGLSGAALIVARNISRASRRRRVVFMGNPLFSAQNADGGNMSRFDGLMNR
jgi:hypothetical protein